MLPSDRLASLRLDQRCPNPRPDLSRPAHRVVLGLWMMRDDGDRRLLGHELVRYRELHAERLTRREETEDDLVILEVRAGAVAPGVAFPTIARNAKVSPD